MPDEPGSPIRLHFWESHSAGRRVTIPPMRWILLLSLLLVSSTPATSSDATSIRNTIGDFFALYLLRVDKRSPEDKITVRSNPGGGYDSELSYWRSLKSRDAGKELCE